MRRTDSDILLRKMRGGRAARLSFFFCIVISDYGEGVPVILTNAGPLRKKVCGVKSYRLLTGVTVTCCWVRILKNLA